MLSPLIIIPILSDMSYHYRHYTDEETDPESLSTFPNVTASQEENQSTNPSLRYYPSYAMLIFR